MGKTRNRLGLFILTALLLLSNPLPAPAAECADAGAGVTVCCVCCVCDCGGSDDGGQAVTENDAPDNATANEADVQTADVRLNELLPNPVGDDREGEFIELYNNGSSPLDLDGWRLVDGRDRTFELDGKVVGAGDRLSLPFLETGLTLANSGGSLALIDPSGTERDSVTYGESTEGMSFSRFTSGWEWTATPTPGAENLADAEPVDGTEETGDDAAGETEPIDDGTADETEAGADEGGSTDENADEDGTSPAEADYSTYFVRLSEIMPNPVGNDAEGEWLEVANLGDIELDLTGWLVDDAEGGSSAHELPEGTVVPAGGWLVLHRAETGISLNNGSDTARLLAPNGTVIDAVYYADVAEGESYARFSDLWLWTTVPTPGAENELPPPDTDEPTDETDSDDSGDFVQVSVEQAHGLEDGTKVSVTAIVTLPPGIAGKTIFGIQDTDTEFGASVRMYGTDRPELESGDLVTVTGTIARKPNGELRINSSTGGVTFLQEGEPVDPTELPLDELDAEGTGLTVSVEGLVADSGKNWFTITDADGLSETRIDLPDGEQPDVEIGDRVSVSGVVRTQSASLTIEVLTDEDITRIETDETEPETAGEDTAGGMVPLLAVGAIGASGFAYRGIRSKQPRGRANSSR